MCSQRLTNVFTEGGFLEEILFLVECFYIIHVSDLFIAKNYDPY